MADEREGADGPRRSPATQDVIQQGGRKANAARPLNAAEDHGGPERYPPVDQTDAVERATPVDAGRFGPQGDPAEGKR